jgi:hypothetical protein
MTINNEAVELYSKKRKAKNFVDNLEDECGNIGGIISLT